jgi:hypothetical protein
MAIPEKIQEAADQSKKMIEDLAKAKRGGNPEPEPQTGPAPGSPEAAALKQDAAQAQDLDNKGDQRKPEGEDPKQEPRAKDADNDLENKSGQPEGDGGDGGEPDEVDWKEKFETLERRFKTLEGKYNAEVPRYAAHVKELNRNIQGYEAEIRRLKEAQTLPQQGQPPPAGQGQADEIGEIDPKNFEDYGEEMQDLANKLKWAITKIKSLEQEKTQLKQEVGQINETTRKSEWDHFEDKISQRYPCFEQQNHDPEFMAYLRAENVDLAGPVNRRDVDAVVEVYKGWPGAAKYAPTPKPKQDPNIDNQVAPPRGKPTGQNQNASPMWKRSDISKAYDDIKKGVYTEAEAMKIKRDIFNATREGRITD